MEMFTLEELLLKLNPEKDWMDILEALSVPILSLFAIIITAVISLKQWFIMLYEYRLKLYPDRWKLYKYLVELNNDLQREREIVGDKYRIALSKIEKKMFLYNTTCIDDKYKDLIQFLDPVNITIPDLKKEEYLELAKTKLSQLIDELKTYLLKYHIRNI